MRTSARLRFAMLSFGFAAGLAAGSATAAEVEGQPASVLPNLNKLTDAEKAAGWNLLFDGHGTGGWRKDGARSRYDQQPIEAQSTGDACLSAWLITKDERWREDMQRAFEWFLGRNDVGMPLYDYTTGGCYDGLSPDGVNLNQGAESTLVFLLALLQIRLREVKRKEGS